MSSETVPLPHIPGGSHVVYYRRRTGDRRILRSGTHHNTRHVPEKEFRIMLIEEYNRTNKRVIKIQFDPFGIAEDVK